ANWGSAGEVRITYHDGDIIRFPIAAGASFSMSQAGGKGASQAIRVSNGGSGAQLAGSLSAIGGGNPRCASCDATTQGGLGAVRDLVLRDPRIAEARLELAHPGDSVRVLRALDAIEPLHKPDGPGRAFPGFLGPPHTVGHGRTHRLDGFTVVQVTEFPFPARG